MLGNVIDHSVTLSSLWSLSKKLSSERYKPILVRRLWVNKLQGCKILFGVQSIRDKVIQMLIQPRFELEFSDYLYGFRPLKSCYTALNAICKVGKKTTGFLELDLVKIFDRIHHLLLMQEVKKNFRRTDTWLDT